jgi:hypothetical protein
VRGDGFVVGGNGEGRRDDPSATGDNARSRHDGLPTRAR